LQKTEVSPADSDYFKTMINGFPDDGSNRCVHPRGITPACQNPNSAYKSHFFTLSSAYRVIVSPLKLPYAAEAIPAVKNYGIDIHLL
jgi:hypothetical protein